MASVRLSVECKSEVTAEGGRNLHAHEVKAWLDSIPDGATLSQIIKDFGSQRDPDPVLVGLRAKWSETR